MNKNYVYNVDTATVDLTSSPSTSSTTQITPSTTSIVNDPFEKIPEVENRPETLQINPIPGRFSSYFPPSRMIPVGDRAPEGWHILDPGVHERKLCGLNNYLVVLLLH